ncbi:WD40-repeat-containing domain protein [Phakopsora pachyrhizi]|nr:WD40-repeat-containing domain protein [Phakopsora pachyrhizi]
MSLEGHQSEVKSVAWNRNGTLLATCSRDKTVWVWEIIIPSSSSPKNDGFGAVDGEEGYEVVSVLMDHEQDVKSVCWSPVEDLLCSTSYDNNIHLYSEDPSSDGDFVLVHRLMGHQSTVWSASFSSCGQYLVSVSDDLSMVIWGRQRIGRGGIDGRDGGLDGGWRIGRSERERWVSVKKVSGIHSRTIYSVDWTFLDHLSLQTQKDEDEDDESLGFIVTAGGDGKINVFQIVSSIFPSQVNRLIYIYIHTCLCVCIVETETSVWFRLLGFGTGSEASDSTEAIAWR